MRGGKFDCSLCGFSGVAGGGQRREFAEESAVDGAGWCRCHDSILEDSGERISSEKFSKITSQARSG